MKEREREGGMFVSKTDRQTDRQTETTLRRSKKSLLGPSINHPIKLTYIACFATSGRPRRVCNLSSYGRDDYKHVGQSAD